MDLGQAVRAATQRQRQAGSYLGTVTAIDAGNAALTIDIGTGVPLTGVRWVGSYAPTVNDFVTVLRSGSAWTVLGKLSKDLRGAAVVRETVTVTPAAAWWGVMVGNSPGDSSWGWVAATSGYVQGKTVGTYPEIYGTLLMYPSIAKAIPSGATIESARLTLVREWDDGAATTRYPRISGHNASSPPSGTGGPPSVTVPGYGPWSPGTLTQGQSATWALPSGWIAAMVAGTVTGLSLYSSAPGDWMRLLASAPITITYHL